jgi:hypothetical protein
MFKKKFSKIKRFWVKCSTLVLVIFFLSQLSFALEIMNVEHRVEAPCITTSSNSFPVKVTDCGTNRFIQGATVTLYYRGNQIARGTTNQYGAVNLNYRIWPCWRCRCIKVVVEKSGYLKYEGASCLKRYPPGGELWVSFHAGGTIGWTRYRNRTCLNGVFNFEYRLGRISYVLEIAYNDFMWAEIDEHFHWWNVSPTIRYHLPLSDKVRGYMNLGPGLYIPRDGDVRFGGKVGLGVDFHLSERLILEMGTDYHTTLKKGNMGEYEDSKFSFQHFHAGFVYKIK